ncbi:MAG: class I SAM-dependent methyltransferase [Pseudomonadota bacterium]
MSHSPSPTGTAPLTARYDGAASVWGDKMRTLGYYDAYLGFLSSQAERPAPDMRVADIGCGSGAFAEAWAAIHGPGGRMTLLDPSGPMLDRAGAALARRGLQAERVQGLLGPATGSIEADHILAAHIIEHCPDPVEALLQMRAMTRPGGQLWLVASKPHWCNAIIWLQWRHRTFQPHDIEKHLTAAGWQLESEYAFPSGPPSRTSRGYIARAV